MSRKRDSASENLEDVWLAVEEECISILDATKLVRMKRTNESVVLSVELLSINVNM